MGHYGSWGRLLISIIVSLAYQTRLFLAEPPPPPQPIILTLFRPGFFACDMLSHAKIT